MIWSLTRSKVEAGYLNIKAAEMELYQNMIRDLVFISPTRKAYQHIIAKNTQGQPALWKYGISGDLPIVLLTLGRIDHMAVLYDVLKAQEYWRLMDLHVDLVIVSEEKYSYSLPLFTLVKDIVTSSQTHTLTEIPEDIFLLEGNKVTPEDLALLHDAAHIIINGNGATLAEQMKRQHTPEQPQKLLPRTYAGD